MKLKVLLIGALLILTMQMAVAQDAAATVRLVNTVNSCGTVTNRRKRQARPDLSQELTRVVEQRLDAYSHGNKQEYASFLADEYLSTDWTGAVLVLDKSQAVQRLPGPSAGGWFVYHIDEVQVCDYRGTAVMSFRVARDEVWNGHTFPSSFHYRTTNVFTRRGKHWELIADHGTAIPVERTAVRLDPKTFDAYVGQYDQGNGMIITVTTDGTNLYYQRTGRPRHELLPESEAVFFVPGDPGSYIFTKDEQGRIAYFTYRNVGGQTAAPRIR